MSTEMKFVRRREKYTRQDYKTGEDILSEFKVIPVVNKIKITEINNYDMFGEWTETDRQTATLNCEISTVWERKPRATPQKTSVLLVGLEQGTRHKTVQVI
jgi:hypothetical protein